MTYDELKKAIIVKMSTNVGARFYLLFVRVA